jgi:hypothetical protein
MYISSRAALVRNISVSIVNGTITLIILLIAPLGMTAVIINTILVAVATYLVTIAADRVIKFLQHERQLSFISQPSRSEIRTRDRSGLNRRQ